MLRVSMRPLALNVATAPVGSAKGSRFLIAVGDPLLASAPYETAAPADAPSIAMIAAAVDEFFIVRFPFVRPLLSSEVSAGNVTHRRWACSARTCVGA